MADQNLVPPQDEPIAIQLDGDGSESAPSEGVRVFGGAKGMGAHVARTFKRALNTNGQGATRCRVFHSRIAAAPLEYMENQINQWLDGDQIEIKHVGHVIGTMEGKTPEPNVIVMVWF